MHIYQMKYILWKEVEFSVTQIFLTKKSLHKVSVRRKLVTVTIKKKSIVTMYSL